MPESTQYDVRELENLALSYDVTTKELDPRPRIVDGSNMYVTLGGKLSRRPGWSYYDDIPALPSNLRPERIGIYRTVGDGYLHIVASVRDTSIVSPVTYKFYYHTEGSGLWNPLTVENNSLEPHEILIAHGQVFIRLEGISTYSELYNARVLRDNGSGVVSDRPWGLPEDPTAPALVAIGSWGASTGTVTVRIGWKYAYGYGNELGALATDRHFGNRSEWVDTGAFIDKVPQVTITPYADNLIYPQIIIYRTTDGGGLFLEVDRVVNDGTGTPFTWIDNGGTAGDPVADADLDFTRIAPDMVINSGPPARIYPSVYSDPAGHHSNIAYFARRIWYGIENRLYFSGQEEIYTGVPEECFPDPDGIRGNWYILPHDIVSLSSAQDRLFIFTTDDVYVVIGEDRTNIRLLNFARGVGMKPEMKLASTSYRDTTFVLSKDAQVYAIVGNNAPVAISDAVGTTLRTRMEAATDNNIQLVVWSQVGYTWLVVNFGDGYQMVYDIGRGFWFPPWSIGTDLTAVTVGRLSLDDPREYLIGAVQDVGGTWKIAVLDFTANIDGTAGPYQAYFTTNLLDLPAGNHVNLLRQPGHHPMLSYVKLERTKFTSDNDPTVSYRLDEFSGDLTTATSYDPPFIAQRSSYKIHWFPVQVVCQRVQVKALVGAVNQAFEVQTLGLIFTPEAGA
jgi:hypothetical protein